MIHWVHIIECKGKDELTIEFEHGCLEVDRMHFVDIIGLGSRMGKRLLRLLNRHSNFRINNDEIEGWGFFGHYRRMLMGRIMRLKESFYLIGQQMDFHSLDILHQHAQVVQVKLFWPFFFIPLKLILLNLDL